ncbi:VOC family protein [uncultured Imperialibacter sp.]|uniref:VOC family protein n=1 Tax=uncultured Imperialibacter sp. TaxID=1672639 RepID=UPI0030DA801B|tara:strand:- start:33334 stop:33762 length:429 start_codon:yes stop_codon:yes gene_type:complete
MKAISIIPCLGYINALTAIDWLCDAFGFEKHQVFSEDNGVVSHAELVLGNCMIMVGTQDTGSAYSKLIKHPSETGTFETQSPYIVLDESEVDALYEKARQHGARIAIELTQQSYGGKNFSCYDLEGHLWNFGSYDPWSAKKR